MGHFPVDANAIRADGLSMNVLFVDDEPKVLRAIERSLSMLQDEWTIHFRSSAAEAWEVIDNEDIDVVISDMRMPDVDGADFLKTVRDRAPEITRLILSGYKDDDASVRSAASAHRFLAKPVSGKELIKQILAAGLVGSDDDLRNAVGPVDCLRSSAVTALAIGDVMSEVNVDMLTLGEIVKKDPALTLKVLQLGNSAFFGAESVIADVDGCLGKIGPDALRGLYESGQLVRAEAALGVSDVIAMRIQEHAMRCVHDVPAGQGNLAELGALLHVIGRVLYANYGLDVADLKDPQMCATYGDHRELGEKLLHLWGIPSQIIEAVSSFSCRLPR